MSYRLADHAAHREEDNARSGAYYIAHREEILAQRRIRAAAHREEKAAANAAYRAAHREKLAAANLAYRVAHPEQVREYRRKFRAIQRGAPLCDHPACLTIGADRLAWQTNPHVCYLCGTPVASVAWMDHVIPVARGGAHCAENLRPACATCNMRKYAKEA